MTINCFNISRLIELYKHINVFHQPLKEIIKNLIHIFPSTERLENFFHINIDIKMYAFWHNANCGQDISHI